MEETQSAQLMNNINSMPETLTNPIYTPAFLRQQIGKLMRVEFLIGTTNLTDRIGILEEVGASYILLRSFENDSLVYCDLYSIKFITISANSSLVPLVSPNNRYMQNGYWQNNMR